MDANTQKQVAEAVAGLKNIAALLKNEVEKAKATMTPDEKKLLLKEMEKAKISKEFANLKAQIDALNKYGL